MMGIVVPGWASVLAFALSCFPPAPSSDGDVNDCDEVAFYKCIAFLL